jgi:2-keto-3-deoxy-L-rhamnonate aldolase RhmA
MTLAKFTEESNRQNVAIVQIETLGALEQASDIAAIDGVDALFVGPSDMSLELGVLGQYENEKLWAANERVSQACRRHGKTWGTIAVNPAFARRAADLGCRLLSFGGDSLALRRGIESFKHSFGEFFA